MNSLECMGGRVLDALFQCHLTCTISDFSSQLYSCSPWHYWVATKHPIAPAIPSTEGQNQLQRLVLPTTRLFQPILEILHCREHQVFDWTVLKYTESLQQ